MAESLSKWRAQLFSKPSRDMKKYINPRKMKGNLKDSISSEMQYNLSIDSFNQIKIYCKNGKCNCFC